MSPNNSRTFIIYFDFSTYIKKSVELKKLPSFESAIGGAAAPGWFGSRLFFKGRREKKLWQPPRPFGPPMALSKEGSFLGLNHLSFPFNLFPPYLPY